VGYFERSDDIFAVGEVHGHGLQTSRYARRVMTGQHHPIDSKKPAANAVDKRLKRWPALARRPASGADTYTERDGFA
jgi:hypothetical protein